MIDLHAHILPGLDDGPEEMEESIAICRGALEDGIHTIVATPHMFNGIYRVSRRDVFEGVEKLGTRLAREGIPLRILPGAETYITTDLPELLEKGEALTLGNGGKYLLLELPVNILPPGLDRFVFSLRLQGYTAIIAHPERNYAVQSDPESLRGIVEGGHLLQVTTFSLTGDFGEEACECALRLLKSGMCHLVASDCHSRDQRPSLLAAAGEVIRDVAGPAEEERILHHNPAAVLGGGTVWRAGEGRGGCGPANAGPDADDPEGNDTRPKRWLRRLWT